MNGLRTLTPHEVPAAGAWFGPERPGPIIHAHVAATGHGRCRVDRWPEPRVVLAELPGNYALRGDPDAVDPVLLSDVEGFVESPPRWLPVLRATDPSVATWDRVVAALPDTADPPEPRAPVRPLVAADGPALAALDPSIEWIHRTWGGPEGLAASGRAWAAFEGRDVVSVAVTFFVGERHEEIGVVTDPAHRGRGLSTACTAALVRDIRARGRRPSWTTSPDNIASRGVAARLGFVHVRDDVLYAVRTEIPT